MQRVEGKNQSYYKSLMRRMVTLVLFVSILPLIIVSGIARQYFQVSYRDKVESHLKTLLKTNRQTVDNFLLDRLRAIRVIGKSYTFEQLMDETFLKERLSILQSEYGSTLVDLGVIDERGIQVAYAGSYPLHGADYAQAQWYKKAVEREHYLSNVFYGLRQAPHFVITATDREEPKWLLRAAVDYEALASLIKSIQLNSGGHAFIVNGAGELQSRLPKGVAPPPLHLYAEFLQSQRGQNGGVEILSDTATGTLNAMTGLKEGEWALGYFQQESEAFAALYSARLFVLLTVLAGVAVIGLVGVLVSRSIVRFIESVDHDKHRMNDQLIEARKLAALGEMAAGIAHEINNPVGIMIQEAGWMQDLMEDMQNPDVTDAPSTTEEFTRSLTRIQTQGKRCRDITHQLLSFARKSDQAIRRTQLNQLIEEVVTLSGQRAKYSNTKIETHLDPDLPPVNISPTEVQQIILNLINNGIDALDGRGGTITISTKAQDGLALVDVADNGPGIPPEMLSSIFEPFFTTKAVGKGTGLGLSICYGIIKKMGGDIVAESEIGKGVTFHITLPLAPGETDSDHPVNVPSVS